jgi:hypothetical protein
MINENGGKLVRTTVYPTDKNILLTMGEVFLDITGDATAIFSRRYSGLQYEKEGLHHAILTNDDLKKWIEKNTSVPSFDLTGFSAKNFKEKIPTAEIETKLTLRKYASVSGKRIFLNPNVLSRSAFVPEKMENRKTNIIMSSGRVESDSIAFHLPETIYPEYLPSSIEYKSRFGVYSASFKVEQGMLIYTRKVKYLKGSFPPDSYQEFMDFHKNITKADNTKIVFLSKT